nr:class I SAM-dependent methyltransferase [Buchnera aphidicola]
MSNRFNKKKKINSLSINFLSKSINFRRKYTKKKEIINRAIRIKNKKKITVLDATAGLGKDSFILASLGYKVFMIEKNKTIYKLLSNGLKRAKKDKKIGKWIKKRMILFHNDSFKIFKKKKIIADVIYLDPMFIKKKKSLPKKDLFFLRILLKKNKNKKCLLPSAIKAAKTKVVVKRFIKAPFLSNKKPNHIIYGKKIRFDIYYKDKKNIY